VFYWKTDEGGSGGGEDGINPGVAKNDKQEKSTLASESSPMSLWSGLNINPLSCMKIHAFVLFMVYD
jgi:hypothetical protein